MATKSSIEYIRLAEDASLDEKKLIAEKVTKGELMFSHYAFDTNKGFFYYEKKTTKK